MLRLIDVKGAKNLRKTMQISYFQWVFVICLVLHTALYKNFVSGSRQLVIKPPGNEFTRGEKMSMLFTCEVTGETDSTSSVDLKWFHDRTEITNKAARRYVEEESPTEKKLYITSIEEGDEGPYRCEGEIDGVLQQRTVNLNLFKDITFDYAPAIQYPAIHTDALIACRVSGTPRPTVSWRYNGKRIQTGPTGGRYTISDNGLHIKNIKLADNGNYTCRADVDSDGRYNEKRLRVEVHYSPRFSPSHPKLVYIWFEKTRNITCNVDANPVPNMEWLRGRTTITNNNTFSIFTSGLKSNLQVRVLEADQRWIYGTYICKASNQLGIQEIEIELRRALMPDAPQTVKVTHLPGGINLYVEPPLNDGGEKIIAYRVEYFVKTKNQVLTEDEDVDQEPDFTEIPSYVEVEDSNVIKLEHLKPNTTYVIRVKARNAVGLGIPTEMTVNTEPVHEVYSNAFFFLLNDKISLLSSCVFVTFMLCKL